MPWTFDSSEITFDSTVATFDGYAGDDPDPPGTAVYPDPSQVATGVQYGPNGDDYTGTMTSGAPQIYFIGVQQP